MGWFTRAAPPPPPSDEVLAFRERKEEGRKQKAAKQKLIDDCGRDGGHFYKTGVCVGCGVDLEF